MEALINGRQICNETQYCANTLGSFQCQCPHGTQLNNAARCEVLPPQSTPEVSSTSNTITDIYTAATTMLLPSVTPTPTDRLIPIEAVAGIVVGALTVFLVLTISLMAIFYCLMARYD